MTRSLIKYAIHRMTGIKAKIIMKRTKKAFTGKKSTIHSCSIHNTEIEEPLVKDIF
jgi:hypothetical protein